MSEAVDIRFLERADIKLILASEAFDNLPTSRQAMAFFTQSNHLITGAIIEGELIGFASGILHYHPDKDPQLFISEVGVNEAYRRRGIARRLVNLLRTRCDTAWLATESDNAPARALYRSADAEETEGIVVYDWGGVMAEGS